jgi:hypothetical protein
MLDASPRCPSWPRLDWEGATKTSRDSKRWHPHRPGGTAHQNHHQVAFFGSMLQLLLLLLLLAVLWTAMAEWPTSSYHRIVFVDLRTHIRPRAWW